MRPFPRAAAVLTLTLVFASVAAADEADPARPIAARRARSTGLLAMLIGGGVFALGYVIDLAAMSSCKFDCAGTGKLAIPVVGYPLYLADDARRAEVTRRAELDRAARHALRHRARPRVDPAAPPGGGRGGVPLRGRDDGPRGRQAEAHASAGRNVAAHDEIDPRWRDTRSWSHEWTSRGAASIREEGSLARSRDA